MKNRILVFGLALAFVACSTEEINSDLVDTAEVSQKLAQEIKSNGAITALNPVTIDSNSLIEGSRYSQIFTDVNDESIPIDRLANGALLLPVFSNGILSYPRNGQLQSDRYRLVTNGRWQLITDPLDGFNRLTPNVNRWHTIDGNSYFLLDSGNFLQGTIWLRIIPGMEMNVNNLERIGFTNRKVNWHTTPITNLTEEYEEFIKRTVLFASTSENEDLGFFYVNFATNIPSLMIEGYDFLPLEVDARSFGGATITQVEFWIDGNKIRTERYAPYEWGQNENIQETLGLSGGSRLGTYRFSVRATDSQGRIATIMRNFYVRTQESILNPF
ncbi:hypothetical protein ABW636_13385 [Aquimarina sp. 2201CG1-2-11]|uniref:hypothetical protein n=1 Tax=Aquimarina discodermiae TaxID=3231043 RepID=UPI003461B432